MTNLSKRMQKPKVSVADGGGEATAGRVDDSHAMIVHLYLQLEFSHRLNDLLRSFSHHL